MSTFSPAGLKRIDDGLKRNYVDTKIIPGYVLRILKDDKLVHSSQTGLMDVERNKPMSDDTIFRVFSMTKPITSVAALILMEEGKLRLDDNVHDYIPSFKNLGVYLSEVPGFFPDEKTKYVTKPTDRPMKVIDLLTHTSGLTYYFMNRTRVDLAYRQKGIFTGRSDAGGISAAIEKLSEVPLDFSPGTQFNYSVSIDVVGYIVEKISGMTLGEFLQAKLFGPLGMKETAFVCPSTSAERLSSCYFPLPGGGGLGLVDDGLSSEFLNPPTIEMGGGGLVSTTEDYLRFCRMLLLGGTLHGARILSPKTVELFSQNFLPDNKVLFDLNVHPGIFASSDFNVGFTLIGAVDVDSKFSRLPGSPGTYWWGGAAGTRFFIDPKENIVVLFMTNVFYTEFTKLGQDIRLLVYGALAK